VCSPHLERILIGENVDLDLLSLFPQMRARIMKGLREKASYSRTTMEESSNQPKEEEGGLL
jgi:hypothetical protein